MRVLAVEDNKDDYMFMVMGLKKHNLENDVKLKHAESGEEALKILKKNKFSLIYLDINLPGIKGTDVLKNIKSDVNIHNTPVIMFTSSERRGDIEKSYENGANMYITKPMGYKEFIEIFGKSIEFWKKIPRILG